MIDNIITKWQEKHVFMLSEYNKLRPSEILVQQLYRGHMQSILDFIEDLERVKPPTPAKVLLIGSGPGKSALLMQRLQEQHGPNIEIFTREEAHEQGLKPEDFVNIPTFKITSAPHSTDATLFIKERSKKSKKKNHNVHNPIK